MNSNLAVRRASVLVLLALATLATHREASATLVASYSFENSSVADGATADGSQNLTLLGSAAATPPAIIGNGKLSLNGNVANYAFSASPGTNGFTSGPGVTLSTWFTTTTVASNTQQVLIQLPIAGGGASQSAAGLEISSGKLQVGGRSVSTDPFRSNDATLPANTLTISSNTTYFAAAVIDYTNDMVTAYLYDGATWKIQPVGAAFTNLTGSGNQGLTLGRRADSMRPFNGSMDDVKIFNTALSEAAVKALIAPEVPEPTSLAILAMLVGGMSVRRRAL